MKKEPRAELTNKSSACPAAFMPASAFILLSALKLTYHQLTYIFILAGARLCFFLSIISSGDSPMLFLAFVLKWFYLSVIMLVFKPPKDSPDYMALFTLLHRKQHRVVVKSQKTCVQNLVLPVPS